MNAANVITFMRIVMSLLLSAAEPFSRPFNILYVLCGVSDMIDGPVARRTDTVSEAGSKLDSAADAVFVSVCLVKFFPVMRFDPWIWASAVITALIRIYVLLSLRARFEAPSALHTKADKAAGFVLFLIPLAYGTALWNGAVLTGTVTALVSSLWDVYITKRIPDIPA